MKYFFKVLFLFFGIILWVSCGQKGLPTGGPKDTVPPKIVSSTPGNYQTNFNQTEWKFKFDEYVQLKNFAKNFIISPPVAKFPEFKLVGKTLILNFNEPFKENTTYNVFFGEGIADFNEGNVLDSNHFVFSTGMVLDSLEFTGKIIDAYTLIPEKEMIVGLYKNLNDTAPLKLIPDYFTKVKDGEFKFTNLAAGEYQIFGLNDLNNNYKFDQPTEKIAFHSSTITIAKDKKDTSFVLKSFIPIPTKQFSKLQSNTTAGKLEIVFNTPVTKDFKWEFLALENTQGFVDVFEQKWSDTKDTLTLFSKDFIANTNNRFALLFTDKNLHDTLRFRADFKQKSAPKSLNNPSIGVSISEPVGVQFGLPILNVDDSKFWVYKDANLIRDYSIVKDKQNIYIQHNWQKGGDYKLILLPNAYTDLMGSNKDTLKFPISFLKDGTTANLDLKFDFKIPAKQYVLLMLMGDKVVDTKILKQSSGTLNWKGVKPGLYRFKLVLDENEDLRWTSGQYLPAIAPEKVINFPEEINLRANWDMEIKW